MSFNEAFFSVPPAVAPSLHTSSRTGNKVERKKYLTSEYDVVSKPDRIMINPFESDINDLFTLSPKVLQVNNARYAIFILTLPFMYAGDTSEGNDARLLVEIKPDGRTAKVTFVTPSILLTPNRLAGKKLPGQHHIVSQAFQNWLSENTEKKGDQLGFDIVLDIPFAAETSTSSDILPHNSGQIISCAASKSSDKATACDVLHSFVVVFKERGNGFNCSRKVISTYVTFSDDDDDDSL